MSARTNPGEGAFPFALLEKPHCEESWAGSLLPREITGSQSCRRECGAVNPCLTWVLLPRAPALPPWLFWDASSVLPQSPPLEWLPLPTHWEGEVGLRARALCCCLGSCWHPLGVEISLSDSTEAWGTPTQARVFLPGLLAQLTGKAKGNSLVWKLCGRKLWSEILLEVHFCWLSSSV